MGLVWKMDRPYYWGCIRWTVAISLWVLVWFHLKDYRSSGICCRSFYFTKTCYWLCGSIKMMGYSDTFSVPYSNHLNGVAIPSEKRVNHLKSEFTPLFPCFLFVLDFQLIASTYYCLITTRLIEFAIHIRHFLLFAWIVTTIWLPVPHILLTLTTLCFFMNTINYGWLKCSSVNWAYLT